MDIIYHIAPDESVPVSLWNTRGTITYIVYRVIAGWQEITVSFSEEKRGLSHKYAVLVRQASFTRLDFVVCVLSFFLSNPLSVSSEYTYLAAARLILTGKIRFGPGRGYVPRLGLRAVLPASPAPRDARAR
jgi:hypothetical protein